jgi:hypothetical protein
VDLAQAPARVFFVPDKSCSIAWLGNGEAMGFSKGGEGVLFTMLMNLHGRLGRGETAMLVPYGGIHLRITPVARLLGRRSVWSSGLSGWS